MGFAIKALVVSVKEKACQTRQVWIGKANTSEPSFKCRNYLDDIKTREVMLPWDKSIGNLLTGWAVSGIEMARVRSWLLCGTAGTCRCDAKGENHEYNLKVKSTNAQRRGGLTRSSDNEPVMGSEQRGQAVLSTHLSTIMGGTNDEDKVVHRLGQWEPGELRGSRRVLREPGGEIPPGYSPVY